MLTAPRRGVIAIALVALASALIMQASGWAAMSNYSLTRAFVHGTARVGGYHWETKDVAWYRGHYYSVKAPILPALTAPLLTAIDDPGTYDDAYHIALDARMHGAWRWRPGISEAQLNSPNRIRVYHARG